VSRPGPPRTRWIEPIDPEHLETRVREIAGRIFPNRLMDDLEVHHLMRVITECSLLLTDVYSDERIARIMNPDPGLLLGLVDQLIERQREGEGEVLYRIRRLPYDVRLVGDKALFDLGLRGLREVKGYDLAQLGSRAYRRAGEALELLADDSRLREFFKQNRLLMLPLEEEVTFLRQCSEQFDTYADILKRVQDGSPVSAEHLDELQSRVPLMAAAAQAIREAVPGAEDDPYVDAARGDSPAEELLSRDQLLSAYERIVLFSSLDMDRLREALFATVIDQRAAVEALCDEFGLFAAGTRDLRKPPAYFLVGPTGVGKNHLVESLCRLLEGIWSTEIPVLTIEGPNYTYPSDINELRGATRGFIRSDEDGLLTTFHERSSKAPLGVILVDEVEKAHPQLRRFFLSILDRGTTTDNRGQVLNFANCIVFFTSNIGYSEVQRETAPIGYLDGEKRHAVVDQDIRRNLHRALSPEFMNRLQVIHFERLRRDSAERILDLELGRIARRYREVHGLEILLEDSAREELIRRGFSSDYGARHLAAILESVCNVEIARRIRGDDRHGTTDREEVVAWLRDVRDGKRAFDPEETRRRVLDIARARLDYGALSVRYENGAFEYVPVERGPADAAAPGGEPS
jgi:MoxR-like ATPase